MSNNQLPPQHFIQETLKPATNEVGDIRETHCTNLRGEDTGEIFVKKLLEQEIWGKCSNS